MNMKKSPELMGAVHTHPPEIWLISAIFPPAMQSTAVWGQGTAPHIHPPRHYSPFTIPRSASFRVALFSLAMGGTSSKVKAKRSTTERRMSTL